MLNVIIDRAGEIDSIFVTVFYLLSLFLVSIFVFSFLAFCGFSWTFYMIPFSVLAYHGISNFFYILEFVIDINDWPKSTFKQHYSTSWVMQVPYNNKYF